jgi:hypothetical protein
MSSRYAITIASGGTQSTSVFIDFEQVVVVGLEIPAEITATSFKIQAKGRDGQWKDLQKDDVDYSVVASANIIQPLRPDLLAAAREVRVVGNQNEGSNRTLYFVMRSIK